MGDELRGKSDAPTSATMGPLRGHGTALYKFEVWANPVTETVEFKFCDAHGRKVELEGRGMEGETHHMGYPPADAIPCNTTADCPTRTLTLSLSLSLTLSLTLALALALSLALTSRDRRRRSARPAWWPTARCGRASRRRARSTRR